VKGCAEKGAARAAGQTRVRHTRRSGSCHLRKRCGIVRRLPGSGKSPLERLPAATSTWPARAALRFARGPTAFPTAAKSGPGQFAAGRRSNGPIVNQ
jgi:hypothetical protein